MVFLATSVFSVDYYVSIGSTVDITIGYGRDFTIYGVSGVSPYLFYSGSCVSEQSSDESKATYVATGTSSTCLVEVEDLFFDLGTVNINVTCVCDRCLSTTDNSMTGPPGIVFTEVAYDDTDRGADDNRMC